MLVSTEAIILRSTKYTNNSFIVNAYSEKFGVLAFFLRTSKKNRKSAFKEVLSIVEISFNQKPGIKTIHDINLALPYTGLVTNFHKRTIALFIAETINKSLQEEYGDTLLYTFLKGSLLTLDCHERANEFHLWFLVHLCTHLGLSPSLSRGIYFNLREGKTTDAKPLHDEFLDERTTLCLRTVADQKFYDPFSFSSDERKALLRGMVTYYKIHVAGFGTLNTLPVLESIYSDISD